MMMPSNAVVNSKSLFNRVIVIFFKEFRVSNEEIGFKDILSPESWVFNSQAWESNSLFEIEINIFKS